MKQTDFEKIIETGTIGDLQEFLAHDFHQIKHTVSFALLIKRLQKAEQQISEMEDKIFDMSCEMKEMDCKYD